MRGRRGRQASEERKEGSTPIDKVAHHTILFDAPHMKTYESNKAEPELGQFVSKFESNQVGLIIKGALGCCHTPLPSYIPLGCAQEGLDHVKIKPSF